MFFGGSLYWLDLDFSGVPIPLANNLVSWASAKLIAKSIRKAAEAIEAGYDAVENFPIEETVQIAATRFKPTEENIDQLRIQGECLYLISAGQN